MTRLLFLDIDGVLNNPRALLAQGMDAIDLGCVKVLNEIVEATEAHIVISSSWRPRDGSKLKNLVKRLIDHGFDCPVIGMTPRGETRGKEIEAWILDFAERGEEVDGVVILDDDDHDIAPMGACLHKVNSETGLTADDVPAVIALYRAQEIEWDDGREPIAPGDQRYYDITD